MEGLGQRLDSGTVDPSSPGPFSPRVPCSQSCTCSGRGTRWHGGPHESEPPDRDEVLSHTAHVPPCSPPQEMPPISLCPDQHSPPPLTRLSSRLATMEANLRSPASSDMRKMYSGAETWLDRWVRPRERGFSGTSWPSRAGWDQGKWGGGAGQGWPGAGLQLTKLLDGAVSTPGQLKCHVDPAPLVLDTAVGLEGNTRAGGL